MRPQTRPARSSVPTRSNSSPIRTSGRSVGLKDAALLTLDIQLESLRAGWTLKDASAYNVAFHDGRPIFIDSLSFERYEDEGHPWIAYRQFCEHFLAPLAVQAWRDVRLSRLLRADPDGVPLDLATSLLSWRWRWTSAC